MSTSAIEFYEALVSSGFNKENAQKATKSIEKLLEQPHKLSALEDKVDNGFTWMRWAFGILAALNLIALGFLFNLSLLN